MPVHIHLYIYLYIVMIMQLESSAENVREYLSLNLLVDEINKHESTQEYVVTKRRIKVFKRDVLMKR